MYLLSELGRQRARRESKGGTTVPKIPNLGRVCLAVGELNLNFCRMEMQAKNIKFLMLI